MVFGGGILMKDVTQLVNVSSTAYKTAYLYRVKTNGAISYIYGAEPNPRTAINQYNTKEAYLYDIQYPYDVCCLPGYSGEYNSITTNDGLIYICDKNNNNTYRIYDVFTESEPNTTAISDSELLSPVTIYKSTPSFSPIEEQQLLLRRTGAKTASYYELQQVHCTPIISGEYTTTFVMPGPIDQTIVKIYDQVPAANVSEIFTSDECIYTDDEHQEPVYNYCQATIKSEKYLDHLYANEIALPNKPYYRIQLLSKHENNLKVMIGSTNALTRRVGNIILVKNPVYLTNASSHITMRITIHKDAPEKLLVGVI